MPLSRYSSRESASSIFCIPPLLGALLFDNTNSDARDHCANERTFLSYLRLSMYMSIVAVAIVVSFHLKSQPSALELRMAKPLGIIFWLLSISCLALGLGNYMKTVNKYSRRAAIVQTGWKTQTVCWFFIWDRILRCDARIADNALLLSISCYLPPCAHLNNC